MKNKPVVPGLFANGEKFVKELDTQIHRYRAPQKLQMLLATGLYIFSHGEMSEQYDRETKDLTDEEKQFLFRMVTQAGEYNEGWEDVLGDAYMCCSSSDRMGQFFTPMPIAKMMAQMTLKDLDPERPLRIGDLCGCGSGRMLLACAEILQESRAMHHFVGVDLDYQCCQMAVLNLAMNSVPAMIIHGNGLWPEVFNAWEVKVMNILGQWVPKVFKMDTDYVKEIYWGEIMRQNEMRATPPPKVELKPNPKPTKPQSQLSLF